MGSRCVRNWYEVARGVGIMLLALGRSHASALAQSSATSPQQALGTAAIPQTQVLVISGVGGEKRFSDVYRARSLAFATAAVVRFGVPDSMVTVLAEDSTRDPARVRGRSTRDNILRELARMGGRARSGDRVVVLLIGHGSMQDVSSRFNIPGPDISADEFRMALAPLRGVTVLFVNTASASGDFVAALSAPDRIIITATKSSREQNETYFPEHFLTAITSDVGDADKDGRVSLLEAFVYARREVERTFEQGNRIATEHALLDDDGDGTGHVDAGEKGPDGLRARAFFLQPLGGVALASDPRAATLMAERRQLELRIDSLRARRASLSEDAYQSALEPLMLSLADKARALRALEAKKP